MLATRRLVPSLTGYLVMLLCALLLAACGGGGSGGNGCTTVDPNRDPNLPGCGTAPATGSPAMALVLQDASGAATATISSGRPGSLVATLRSASNAPVANAVVSFATTDKSGAFVPASATAITDTAADESPSFAPNGKLLVYSTQIQGREALMTTTLDGKIKARLAGKAGDIREPDWGPFQKQ